MNLDISDFKNSNDFLNLLYNNVTSAIFIADSNAVIYHFNDSFQTLFHRQEDQLLGKLCGNAMGCIFQVREGKDCGQTSNCRFCVLRECILKGFVDKVPVFDESLDREFFIDNRVVSKHFSFQYPPRFL